MGRRARDLHPSGGAVLHALDGDGDDPGPKPTGHRVPAVLAATGRLDFGWTTPVGGSQALPDALVRLLVDHGGRVVCLASVAGVETDASGVRRVALVDGRSVEVGRALVAGGHLSQLAGMVQSPTPDLVAARDAWRPGLSVLAVHAALRHDLGFGASGIASAAAGYGTSDGMARHVAAHERGELEADGSDWADVKDSYGERLVSLVADRASGLDAADLSIRTESPVDAPAATPPAPSSAPSTSTRRG